MSTRKRWKIKKGLKQIWRGRRGNGRWWVIINPVITWISVVWKFSHWEKEEQEKEKDHNLQVWSIKVERGLNPDSFYGKPSKRTRRMEKKW